VLEVLLDRGADIQARAHDGCTSLIYAAADGQKGAVEVLLARGADETVRNGEGKTVEEVAPTEEIKGLLRRG
jgi:ankyrin repeat protein